MPSHYSTIGMPLKSKEDYQKLVIAAAQRGTHVGSPGSEYILYMPGEGVELWVQVTEGNTLLGCNPHFSGQGKMHLAITQMIPSKTHAMDGSAHGWANAPRAEPEQGDYPLLVDVPDFALIKQHVSPPQFVTMQIAAFAHTLSY
jgi:hypothetical protein